jgi:hypothetical protein
MAHEENRSLITTLNECALECNHCFDACLEERDMKLLKNCIKLNRDCADVCQLTASLIARDSPHGEHMLKECIEICNACAAECEKHAHMNHCRICAETCRACAEICSRGMMV